MCEETLRPLPGGTLGNVMRARRTLRDMAARAREIQQLNYTLKRIYIRILLNRLGVPGPELEETVDVFSGEGPEHGSHESAIEIPPALSGLPGVTDAIDKGDQDALYELLFLFLRQQLRTLMKAFREETGVTEPGGGAKFGDPDGQLAQRWHVLNRLEWILVGLRKAHFMYRLDGKEAYEMLRDATASLLIEVDEKHYRQFRLVPFLAKTHPSRLANGFRSEKTGEEIVGLREILANHNIQLERPIVRWGRKPQYPAALKERYRRLLNDVISFFETGTDVDHSHYDGYILERGSDFSRPGND